MAKIEAGECVIMVLREPREKIWGILGEIDSAGVFVRGLDLNAFEDFIRAITNHEPFYGLGENFFPMWRVERISRDENDGDIPSLHSQFEHRTGLMLAQL